ncbi:MAG: TRAP transporter large permease [Qingshengfaniella sp.]
MDPRELVGLGGAACLILLILLRIPVVLAMLIVGILGSYALSIVAPFLRFMPWMMQFKSLLWETMASYDLAVIPLFVLMGYAAAHSGLSSDLFGGVRALVGRVRGGLAMSAIVGCAGFGAVCGSSVATASTMGRIALPELERSGYGPGFSAGALAAGGTLGILIPPSVALVIYAVVVEASIMELFRAALIPGIIAVLFFLAVIRAVIWWRPEIAPVAPPMERSERIRLLRNFLPVVAIFGGIILGLGMGLFPPTPAAGVGTAAVLIYGFLRKPTAEGQKLRLPELRTALLETAVTSGMIYALLFGGAVLTGFFTRTGLPMALADWAGQTSLPPYVVLTLCLIGLVILGCFLESLSMIVVVVPFLWPVLVAINGGEYVSSDNAAFGLTIDQLRLWFGILALIVVELGLITPPVGINVFIIASLTPKTSMSRIFLGTSPFFLVEILRVSLLVAMPWLVLIIPSVLAR